MIFSFLSNSMFGGLFYLDPGSGSYLIQLLLAVGLGAGFAIKIYWNKIKEFFSKMTGKKNNEDQEQPHE